jgi:hypothetical protein
VIRRLASLVAALAVSGVLHLWALSSVWHPVQPEPTFGSLPVAAAAGSLVFTNVPTYLGDHEVPELIRPTPVDPVPYALPPLSSAVPVQVPPLAVFDGGIGASFE